VYRNHPVAATVLAERSVRAAALAPILFGL